jgi:signal peptidase II
MQKKLYGYFFLAFFIFIIDRLSKYAALAWCINSPYVVTSFLSCELYFNRGISWGLLHSDSDCMFMGVSVMIAIITVLLCWHAYYYYMRGYSIIGQMCIIVGSLSNLIDRVVYQGVIDFILFSYNGWSWPVFNAADAAIVLGVVIIIFQNEK